MHASPDPVDPTGGKIFDALAIAADKVEIENVPAADALNEAARTAQAALDEVMKKAGQLNLESRMQLNLFCKEPFTALPGGNQILYNIMVCTHCKSRYEDYVRQNIEHGKIIDIGCLPHIQEHICTPCPEWS